MIVDMYRDLSLRAPSSMMQRSTSPRGKLSLAEFGRLLSVVCGLGHAIAFVPEEFVTETRSSKSASPSDISATGTDVANGRQIREVGQRSAKAFELEAP